MGLLSLDGFDQYGNTVAMVSGQTNWTLFQGSINTNPAFVRTGSSSLNIGNVFSVYSIPQNTNNFIVGFAIYPTDTHSIANLLNIYNQGYSYGDAAGQQCFLQVTAGGFLQLIRGNPSGGPSQYILATSNFACIFPGMFQYIEIDFLCDPVAGHMKVYREGELVFSYTGDTNGNGAFTRPTTACCTLGILSNVSTLYFLDDMYMGINMVSPLGPIRCYTQLLDGDTAQADWALHGGATGFGILSTIPENIASVYISSATPGDASNFSITNLPITVQSIVGVNIFSYQAASDAGVCSTKLGMISGSSTTFGSDHNLSVNGGYFQDFIQNDPATGMLWTLSAFNAAELTAVRVS